MRTSSPSAFDLETFLERAPREPGCYLMRDHQGEVIYVGKATHLAARVRSYFKSSSDTRFFVGLLGDVLGSIETTSSGIFFQPLRMGFPWSSFILSTARCKRFSALEVTRMRTR